MQRKSNLLGTYNTHKNGIAMIIAIAFLLITAILMAIMVNMTALTTKQAADTYVQEQAHLLAKSATEFTLLAISARDRTGGNCVTDINMAYPNAISPFYNIRTSVTYIGLNCPVGNTLVSSIQTPESNGTIIIDTYVSSTNTLGLTEPINFHRRTMQKP